MTISIECEFFSFISGPRGIHNSFQQVWFGGLVLALKQIPEQKQKVCYLSDKGVWTVCSDSPSPRRSKKPSF